MRALALIVFSASLLGACGGDAASNGGAASGAGGAAAGVAGSLGPSGGAGGASGSSGGGGATGGLDGGSGGSGAAGAAGASGAGQGGAGGIAGAAGVAPAGESGAAGSSAAAGRGGAAGTAGSAGAGETGIRLDGRRLLVDGVPLHLRGVCWNPVKKGGTHPADLDFAGAAPGDAALMEAIGINVVRTYEPVTSTSVLDVLHDHGIYVLMGTYVYGGDAASVVTARVEAVADHPAILGWVLGNEWNYNGLYVGLSASESMARLNEAATLIRAADTRHPIVSVYGEVPAASVIDAMPDIDLWGINAYRGISFGDLFTVWASRSQKPMFLAEYGADAYNDTIDAYDPDSQALAVSALTQEIADHGVAFHADGVSVGGTLFEWSDEWWKDAGGSPSTHDTGGTAPGGGPYPDSTFNEEWWGIVDIDRATRPAYGALGEVFDALP